VEDRSWRKNGVPVADADGVCIGLSPFELAPLPAPLPVRFGAFSRSESPTSTRCSSLRRAVGLPATNRLDFNRSEGCLTGRFVLLLPVPTRRRRLRTPETASPLCPPTIVSESRRRRLGPVGRGPGPRGRLPAVSPSVSPRDTRDSVVADDVGCASDGDDVGEGFRRRRPSASWRTMGTERRLGTERPLRNIRPERACRYGGERSGTHRRTGR
jgi:hypothetical protein